GIADADGVAAIPGRADDRVGAGADAGLAGVGVGAGVAVVTRGAVGLHRLGAHAGRGIAGARIVALVSGGADDGARAGAGPGLGGGGAGGGTAVVAQRAVRLRRPGAHAGRGIAGARIVALVSGGADDGARAGADAGLAGVGAGAGIAVVARGAVRLRRPGAHAGRGIAGARI